MSDYKPGCVTLYPERFVVKKGWGAATIKKESGIGEVFVFHNSEEKKFRFQKFKHPEGVLCSIKNDLENSICENWSAETVKLLYIEKEKKLSLHFHLKKTEIFYMVEGSLEVTIIHDGVEYVFELRKHDSIIVRPGIVHSMKGLEDNNILLEVSTLDEETDSYRIKKGD